MKYQSKEEMELEEFADSATQLEGDSDAIVVSVEWMHKI